WSRLNRAPDGPVREEEENQAHPRRREPTGVEASGEGNLATPVSSKEEMMSKYDKRAALAAKTIEAKLGKPITKLSQDDLMKEMLKFSETHISWRTVCSVLALTKDFAVWSPSEVVNHHAFQKAIVPGLTAKRAERLTKVLGPHCGFFRF